MIYLTVKTGTKRSPADKRYFKVYLIMNKLIELQILSGVCKYWTVCCESSFLDGHSNSLLLAFFRNENVYIWRIETYNRACIYVKIFLIFFKFYMTPSWLSIDNRHSANSCPVVHGKDVVKICEEVLSSFIHQISGAIHEMFPCRQQKYNNGITSHICNWKTNSNIASICIEYIVLQQVN